MNARGFTALEVAVVVFVVGALGSLGVVRVSAAVQAARVREAAAVLSADVDAARAAARRFNRDASLSFAAGANGSYSVLVNGVVSARSLPAGTRVSVVGASSPVTVTFTAPFGEVSGAAELRVERGAGGPAPVFVKLIGTLGKVSVSATP